MDKELRSLERRASRGEDIANYARALRRIEDPRCDGLFRYATSRGEKLTGSEEDFLAKNRPRQGNFPMNYVGFAVVEVDESYLWSPSIITRVGYTGGIYLIDLTRRAYIASSTPVYPISPLYYSVADGVDIDDEMDLILSKNFSNPEIEVDYTTRDFLGHVINWMLIDIDDYYNPYDSRPLMEQLRQGLIENRVL